MNILLIFLIIVILFVIIYLILFSRGSFTPPALAKVITPSQHILDYKIPSPWSKAIPVSGVTGTCRAITFSGELGLPSIPSYSVLNSCLGSTCFDLNNQQSCFDQDQLFVQEVKHTCNISEGPAAGVGCRKIDGTFALEDEEETYYRSCGNAEQCGGSIGILATNFNPTSFISGSVSGLVCIAVSETLVGETYTYDIPKGKQCDIGDLTQLFRVERFSRSSTGSYKHDSSGLVGRIVHRRSGKCLAPVLTQNAQGNYILTSATSGSDLDLIPCETLGRDGVWWGFTPPITAPDNSSAAPQQIVYIPDISEIPEDLGNITDVWNFLSSRLAIKNGATVGGNINMELFDTGNLGSSPADNLNNQNNFQYIDYGIYHLITRNNLSSYTF